MAITSRFEISKQVHRSSYCMHSAHTHSYYEMFYLIEGSCDLLIKNTVYHLKPGNITFIPSNTLHRTTYTDSNFHERLYIEFTSNYMNELVTQFGTGWLYNNLFSKIFYLPEEFRGDINRLLSRIIVEQQSPDNFSQCMTKMYFQELIIKLLRYIEDSSVMVDNGSSSTNESLTTAINYINENFRNNITLDDMADLLHLNPSYFSKKFKSLNGLGFKEYLNNVRINHSEKLLLETNMSITEIAFECGYDNSNYFGDAFKKINNVSPSTFRRLKGNIQD